MTWVEAWQHTVFCHVAQNNTQLETGLECFFLEIYIILEDKVWHEL